MHREGFSEAERKASLGFISPYSLRTTTGLYCFREELGSFYLCHSPLRNTPFQRLQACPDRWDRRHPASPAPLFHASILLHRGTPREWSKGHVTQPIEDTPNSCQGIPPQPQMATIGYVTAKLSAVWFFKQQKRRKPHPRFQFLLLYG